MTPDRRLLVSFLELADLIVVAASFVAALCIAAGAPDVGSSLSLLQMRIAVANLLFMGAYLLFCHFVFRARGLYHSYRLSPGTREMRDLFIVVAVAVAALILLDPFLQFSFVNAAFVSSFALLAFLGLGTERRLLRAAARFVRRYGRNLRNVIIVGTGDQALDLTSKLARREDLGYRVVAVIETGDGSQGASDTMTVPQRVEQLMEHRPIDELFLALPLDAAQPLIRELISLCEEQGTTIRLMAQVASLYLARATVDEIEGQPVLTLASGPPDTPRLFIKRAIDIVGSAAGLMFLAPLFLVVAIAVKLDSPGPVFFSQQRVGFNRRRFWAYKFRTMVPQAEQMQADLEPLNEARGPVFKIENDPRVTRLGKWLRRLSIDEMPQLLNVLKGDMSLVGPRPLPVRDVSRIDVRWHKRRFSVKPGITCLWQVNSRQPEFDQWIQSDMEYIDNWSLALDFKILVKTIPAVLSGQGAH